MHYLEYLYNFFSINCIAQTYVTTDTDLQNNVNNDTLGENYIIPNGTYADFYCSFTATATAENPITIKAESVGGVKFTGDSHFVFKKAAHIILEGFDFECTGNNTLIKLEASNHIRITRNEFELTTTASVKWVVITGYYNDYNFEFVSNHNRIDHNNFLNKNTSGNYITISGTYNEDYTVTQQSQYDIIDHNYFYNIGPRIENGMEAIRIGNSYLSTSNGYTTVEYNYFDNCDGDPEIVSVKSNLNQINHNTFSACYGTLTLRQGNNSHVEGNYFFGNGKANGIYTDPDTGNNQTIYTGGIRAYGTDHVIVNNYLEGLQGTLFDAPITLTQGDAITGLDTDQSLHYRPERITIACNTLVNNTYGIEIGYAKNNDSYNQSLKDITIANNLITGSTNSLINIHNDQNGELSWSNNYMYPTGSAQLTFNAGTTFSASEVQVQDVLLSNNGDYWVATSNTPLALNESGINTPKDIDGQNRPDISTVGADHFSNSTSIYFPITLDDVGPNAYEGNLSLSNKLMKYSHIRYYPNPTKEKITIDFLDIVPQKNCFITIYDAQGNLLKQVRKTLTDNKFSLNLGGLSSGIYFIKWKDSQKQYTLRIIKN